jgi:hypothetical protein
LNKNNQFEIKGEFSQQIPNDTRHRFPEYINIKECGHSLKAWRNRFNIAGEEHEAMKDMQDLKKIKIV